MSEPVDRWVDRPAGGAAPEDRAAERLREVRAPELDDVRLQAVARRIDAALEAGSRPRGRRWRPRLFAGVLLGAIGAAALVARLEPWHRTQASAVPRDVTPPPVPALPPPPSPAVAPSPATPPGVVEAPPPVARSRPRRQTGSTDALSEESELLRSALQSLNVDRDAQGALRILDRYQARFPAGVLSREAVVARLDADVVLGRTGEALGLLDRASSRGFDGYPRPTQLKLLRAELLSGSGRCAEAEPVFSGVLSGFRRRRRGGAGPLRSRVLPREGRGREGQPDGSGAVPRAVPGRAPCSRGAAGARAMSWARAATGVAGLLLLAQACDPQHMIGAQGDGGTAADAGGEHPSPDGGGNAAACDSASVCPCGQLCASTQGESANCLTPQLCTAASDCPNSGGWACLPLASGCGSICLQSPGSAPASCARDQDCPCGSLCSRGSCSLLGPSCSSDPDCAALGYPCVALYRNGQACGVSVCAPIE